MQHFDGTMKYEKEQVPLFRPSRLRTQQNESENAFGGELITPKELKRYLLFAMLLAVVKIVVFQVQLLKVMSFWAPASRTAQTR